MNQLLRKEPTDRCWLCLRITPEWILEQAHRLWDDENAYQIGVKTAQLVKEIYLTNPTLLCGRPSRAVVSPLFYIMGSAHLATRRTMREIAEVMGVAEVTIRNNSRILIGQLPFIKELWETRPKRFVLQPSTFMCQYCGKEFQREWNPLKPRPKFCSMLCKGKADRRENLRLKPVPTSIEVDLNPSPDRCPINESAPYTLPLKRRKTAIPWPTTWV